MSAHPNKQPTTHYAQVRFVDKDNPARPPSTSKPARPSNEPPMSRKHTLPTPYSALPPASVVLRSLAAESTCETVGPTTDAEAATERMDAAAAHIEARQRCLDKFNAQLYHTRKYQHRMEGVDWHETQQVPGDPWQPHQMSPTRVGTVTSPSQLYRHHLLHSHSPPLHAGIISRSLLPCATRAQPVSPPAVHGVGRWNDLDSRLVQLPEREHSFIVRQIRPASQSRMPSLMGPKHG